MFYHIVTSLLNEEEIALKYEEYTKVPLDNYTKYVYTVNELVNCPPLYHVVNKLLFDGEKYKEILILKVGTVEELKKLPVEFRELLFQHCLHMNIVLTEPFSDIYRSLINK